MRLLHPNVREITSYDLPDLYDVAGPHLRAGFVLSADGVVAVDGTSTPLSSPADKAVFRALRTVSDAVLVGAGTARDEDYGPVRHGDLATAWRAAHGRSAQTPLVVVTRSGRIPDTARFLEGPLIVAAPEGVDVRAEGADLIRTTDPVPLTTALHERGFTRLLCEGGPSLLTAFFNAGLVDELCLTTSPRLVGAGPHLLGGITRAELQLLSLVHDDPGVLLSRWGVVRSPGG